MPRPTSKTELLKASREQFEKLWKLIASMPQEEQTAAFLFEDRDKNLRDILIHLYEWHQLLLNWVHANRDRKDGFLPFLPEPYNWKTYPQMNVGFWEKHQGTSYADSQRMVKESHARVMELMDGFSDDELFIKKFFPWTGTTSLGGYCISAASSHYDWAMKKIKTHRKTYGEAH